MLTVFNQPIWGDEGFSAILSMKSLPEVIKVIISDTSPPLWNIWEWIVFNTLGTDEIYIRGLAFTFFLGALFFTYKIADHLYNRATAIWAVVLTFLNPFFFTYAFEGRMYSIMALGVAGSMYYFLKIFAAENEVRKSFKFGYVFWTLWALYSHHFAMFAVLVQGLWFLYNLVFAKRKRAKLVFKLFIYTFLGYLPWVYPLYLQVTKVGGGFWLGTPTTQDLKTLIYDYLSKGIKDLDYVVPVVNTKVYELAHYFVLAAFVVRNWFKGFRKSIFLLLWFFIPILATWGVSQVFQSIFFNRYILYTIPAAMILLASSKRGKISMALLGIICILFAIIDWHYFTHPKKMRFDLLAQYIQETKNDDDYLINWNSASHHIWETKYYGFGAPIYIPGGGELPYFVGTALMEEGDIIDTLPQNINRVGVVTSGPLEEIDLPGYTEADIKTYGNLKFAWFETKDDQKTK